VPRELWCLEGCTTLVEDDQQQGGDGEQMTTVQTEISETAV
jgi:hypothetical protein